VRSCRIWSMCGRRPTATICFPSPA
jgi:hypothetical protein